MGRCYFRKARHLKPDAFKAFWPTPFVHGESGNNRYRCFV
jgi:hypothetical protein